MKFSDNHHKWQMLIPRLMLLGFLLALLYLSCTSTLDTATTKVLVIGGGTGGTAAGIQAARMGVKTIIVERSEWLGGMLTAAGVSAVDGNHNLPAGLWGEFRDSLYARYGGPKVLATGWVSNTQFEPSVGAAIFNEMAQAQDSLEVWYNSTFVKAEATSEGWKVWVEKAGKRTVIETHILIDGTDLGDVAAAVGVKYDLGMDARSETGEAMAPESGNDIIQDFTYVATLKDYGEEAPAVEKPNIYNPQEFYCACQQLCPDTSAIHSCDKMLSYGKLPNDKYMINWPLHGNDYYAPIVEMSERERRAVYEKAKAKTLAFVYFIQNELGYKNLGLADDEFPTADQLPFLPYHREGRRIDGLVRLNANHLTRPFEYQLYRTGIAVGDYPIDHHHAENPDAPEIDFPKIAPFNIPLGSLIPKNVDNFLVADKAISVTNIVNGASRLQPVILQVGQAAGTLAALSHQRKQTPAAVPVQAVQHVILRNNGYLMPYVDVPLEHPQFEAIQKIGAMGLLRGTGEPWKWANRTWFYPDSVVQKAALRVGVLDFEPQWDMPVLEGNRALTIDEAMTLIARWMDWKANTNYDLAKRKEYIRFTWEVELGLDQFDGQRPVTRAEFAKMLDFFLNPFNLKMVDISGNFQPLQ